MLTRLAARAFWRLSRWTMVAEPLPAVGTVIIGAPHTSNWDFIFMLATGWRAGVRFSWLGKQQLFAGPLGPLMRGLGGIPVDRSGARGLVATIVARVEAGERLALVVTPEGTRGRGEYWRSGFYRIATGAGLPLTLGFVDRDTMTCGIGPTIDLSGEVRSDMDAVRAFYADKSGFRPGLVTPPRLREEDAGA
ncbi:1-acyl-sn-glycerol-3-phosphate acyltransferase [Pseudactinotalea sp. HY158]|uniref:1-acyl-sn-glycerol-3-phosphate acyltransferase n=1 Tax=Pseudactinotalea sp. HY158 TaxID=2654547 RepID=UPI001892814A|nr:1-acyl-sn-glycerol-3-phosphate acyltransferase [Pseudactinotalea sp. HY158]